MSPIQAFALANIKHGCFWKFGCVTFFRGQFKTINMAASSREWEYEESSVEYESETSVISYTRD